MFQEEVPCAKCKDGLHLSCLNPIVVPATPSSSRVLTFSEWRTFTCCDRADFWTRPVYRNDEEDKSQDHRLRIPAHV